MSVNLRDGRPSARRPLSLPFVVLFYFSRNPEEELTSREVAVKFDYSLARVAGQLRPLVQLGYLSVTSEPIPPTELQRIGGRRYVYTAGPELLNLMRKWDNEAAPNRPRLRNGTHSESTPLPSTARLFLPKVAGVADT